MVKQKALTIDSGEWLTNPTINSLPYEYKGIWVTMLCLLWESPTRGVLKRENGSAYKLKDILRLLKLPNSEPIERFVELGLLAINGNEAYYSPQIVKRERISELRRIVGRKGGEITKTRTVTFTEVMSSPSVEKIVIAEQPQAPTPMQEAPPQEKKKAETQLALELPIDVPPNSQPPELTLKQKAKIEKNKKYSYAEFVTLTTEEYTKLVAEHTQQGAKRMIQILDNYKGQSGKKYKSDYRAILNWVVQRYNEETYGRQYTATNPNSGGNPPSNAGNANGTLPLANPTSPQSGYAQTQDYTERF